MLPVFNCLFCVATVTPCAQWCINVWMSCNWSNQIDVLFQAPSDADCHLYPLLLFVLVDILCLQPFFLKKKKILLLLFFKRIALFFLCMPRLCGIYVCPEVVLGFIFTFPVTRHRRMTAYGKEKRLERSLACGTVRLSAQFIKVRRHNQHGWLD